MIAYPAGRLTDKDARRIRRLTEEDTSRNTLQHQQAFFQLLFESNKEQDI